jgi:hypothetical protein
MVILEVGANLALAHWHQIVLQITAMMACVRLVWVRLWVALVIINVVLEFVLSMKE